MTRLSDRLTEAKNAVDLSVDAAVLKAQEAGFSIERSVVYRALRGRHAKSPTEATLAGLAAVFNIPVTELRVLVDAPAGELGPYRPPPYANRLSRDQRVALDVLIRTIVEPVVVDASLTGKGSFETSAEVTKLRPRSSTEQVPKGAAARKPGEKSEGQKVRDDQALDE